MELVEGPTLHDAITGASAAAGKAAIGGLPVDEAMAIARQLVEALEFAHDPVRGRPQMGGLALVARRRGGPRRRTATLGAASPFMFAVSPDGRYLVGRANEGTSTTTKLLRRAIGDTAATFLPGRILARIRSGPPTAAASVTSSSVA